MIGVQPSEAIRQILCLPAGWQGDHESRALVGSEVQRDRSAVFLDDRFARKQPSAPLALEITLGAEPQFKDAISDNGGNAGPVVDHAHFDLLGVRLGDTHPNRAAALPLPHRHFQREIAEHLPVAPGCL